MSGLISFLVASTIFAAIGTAVRGLLRPISWALLALALGLLISNRLTGIPGETEDLTNQTTPAPLSPSDRPIAREGWQAVARELEPVYANTLVEAQATSGSGSGNSNGSSTDSITTAPASPTSSGSRQSASAPTAVRQSPSPIPGLW